MKKTLHILLALIFLLSLGSLTANGQSETTSFAYIPLVSPASPDQSTSVPIEFRARQGFEALMSRLLDAQAKGQIVRFEPEFSFGLLKVEYVSGFDLSAILGTGRPIFEDPQSVLDYTQAGEEIAISSPASVATPYFSVSLFSNCFYGYSLTAGNYYLASLSDTGVHVVASANGWISSGGGLGNCFEGAASTITPGYKITIKIYNSTGTTLLKTYSTTIPSLGFTSFDIPHAIVNGTAPAGSQLEVNLWHPKLNAANGSTDVTKHVTTSGAGNWQVSFGTAMRGGDEVKVTWQKPATYFTFYRYLYAPNVDCVLGGDYCDLYGIPGKPASLSIKHAGKTYTFTGLFTSWGGFWGYLPYDMAVGDKISGTGVTSLTLPTITAVLNYTANTVTGKAPANRYIDVDLDKYYPRPEGYYYRWVKANSAGNYTADFSSSIDITLTDSLEFSVYYTNPTTGNEVSYYCDNGQ
jgi:hypothetical protein